MGLIITSIILSIITVVGVCLTILWYNSEENRNVKKRWSLLGLLWLILIIFGCFINIGANTVGIIYNPFKGGVQNEVLGQGIRLKSPLEKVYKISTEVKEFTFKDISVQTNDSQYVNTELQVQLRLDSTKTFEYFKKYGGKDLDDIKSIISNTTQQKLEEITTQYNIMEVLGEKRSEIINKTLGLIKEELIKDGILVERIILIDTDAGQAIEKAIADEAVAKKNAEAAEYNKQKAQLEGEAKVIQAQKEKEANELLEKSLTNSILTEKMIEKWNGQLPTTILNDDIMSIFNVNK